MKFSKKGFALGLAMAAVTVLTACGGGDDGIDDRIGISKPSVRLIDAVPVAPNIDLLQNGALTPIRNVPYKYVSGYFDVDTGNQVFAVNSTGTSTQLGQTTVDAHTGHKYTVVAFPGNGVVDLVQIDDPYNKGIISDKARIRGLNASFNAQNVDMYITAPAVDLATVGPTLAAVGYKQAVPASGSDSIDVDGGTYRLRITTAGTKVVIFDSGTLTLNNNADWLITTIASNGLGALVPNSIKVLVAQSNTSSQTALELTSQ
jgi:hypothetical protein